MSQWHLEQAQAHEQELETESGQQHGDTGEGG